MESFTYSVAGLAKADTFEGFTVDDANDDVFNPSTDGSIHNVRFTVEPGTKAVFLAVSEADAPDLDLFVGLDNNLDGKLTNEAEFSRAGICYSADADSAESCVIQDPPAGIYYAAVHNFAGTGQTDRHVLSIAKLVDDNGNLSTTIPDGIQPREAFAVTVNYRDLAADSTYLGMLTMGTSLEAPESIGSTTITIKRGPSLMDAESPETVYAYADDILTYQLNVGANTSGASREVVVSVELPPGWTALDSGNGIVIDGQSVSWTISQAAGAQAIGLSLSVDLGNASGLQTHALAFDIAIDGDSIDRVVTEEITVEGLPVALIAGNASHSVSVQEGSEVSISASDSHSPLSGDSLSYSWTQVSGPEISLLQDGDTLSFTAPEVSANTAVVIELVVNNGRKDSQPATLTVNVTNSASSGGSGGGGSTGVIALLLLAGASLARRR